MNVVLAFLVYAGSVGAGLAFLYGVMRGVAKVVEIAVVRVLGHFIEGSEAIKDLTSRVERLESEWSLSGKS